MARGHFLALACLLLLGSGSLAQEAQDCSAVEQAKAQLELQLAQQAQNDAACQESIKHMSSGLEKARADIAELKAVEQQKNAELEQLRQQSHAEKEAVQAAYQSQVSELQASSAAQLSQAQSEYAAKLAKVQSEYAAQVAQLQAQLSSKSKLNVSEVLSELLASSKVHLAAAVDEVKLVAAGLQQGNTTHLNILFHKVTAAAASAARAAYALVSKGLDEHLPFVKQHLTDMSTKAEGLYQKHIGDAAWVAEVKKQLGQINTDLKAFLQAQTKAYPALKPLDDPVYLQLAAYFIMAAPLLLLLLPVLLWIITLVAPSSKASAAPSKSSKKKKGKAAAAGRPKAA